MKNGDILKGNCSWRKHLQAIRRHIRRKTSRCTVPCSASPLRCSKSAVDWKRRWDDTNSFPVAMKFELSGTDFSQLACQNCLWEMCDLLFGILQKKLCLVASNHSKKLTSQVFFKLQPWKWCQSFIEEIPSHANLRFPLLIQRFPAGSCYIWRYRRYGPVDFSDDFFWVLYLSQLSSTVSSVEGVFWELCGWAMPLCDVPVQMAPNLTGKPWRFGWSPMPQKKITERKFRYLSRVKVILKCKGAAFFLRLKGSSSDVQG